MTVHGIILYFTSSAVIRYLLELFLKKEKIGSRWHSGKEEMGQRSRCKINQFLLELQQPFPEVSLCLGLENGLEL
jgi:hypothetical protein